MRRPWPTNKLLGDVTAITHHGSQIIRLRHWVDVLKTRSNLYTGCQDAWRRKLCTALWLLFFLGYYLAPTFPSATALQLVQALTGERILPNNVKLPTSFELGNNQYLYYNINLGNNNQDSRIPRFFHSWKHRRYWLYGMACRTVSHFTLISGESWKRRPPSPDLILVNKKKWQADKWVK